MAGTRAAAIPISNLVWRRHTNPMKFIGQLLLRKIIKTVATRWQILRLKCTKIDFGWGSAPDPDGGNYSAPQTPRFNSVPTSKGSERCREGEGRDGKGRKGLEMGSKGSDRKRGKKRGGKGGKRKGGRTEERKKG